jgi:hypothetical protein
MVPDLHAKRQCFLGHVAADAAHSQDAEDLALRIVSKSRGSHPTPLSRPESGHADAHVTECAQEEEDGHVRRRIVDGRRRVGHADAAGSASLDVYLIVAGAVVADKPERAR